MYNFKRWWTGFVLLAIWHPWHTRQKQCNHWKRCLRNWCNFHWHCRPITLYCLCPGSSELRVLHASKVLHSFYLSVVSELGQACFAIFYLTWSVRSTRQIKTTNSYSLPKSMGPLITNRKCHLEAGRKKGTDQSFLAVHEIPISPIDDQASFQAAEDCSPTRTTGITKAAGLSSHPHHHLHHLHPRRHHQLLQLPPLLRLASWFWLKHLSQDV